MTEILLGMVTAFILYFGYRIVAKGLQVFGIQAESGAPNPSDGDPKPFSREEFKRELHRFRQGDRGDTLRISGDTEDEPSIVTLQGKESPELLVSFILPEEAERLATFKTKLAAAGHHPTDENQIKASRRLKVVVLTYNPPRDFESLTSLIDQIILARCGNRDGTYQIDPPT